MHPDTIEYWNQMFIPREEHTGKFSSIADYRARLKMHPKEYSDFEKKYLHYLAKQTRQSRRRILVSMPQPTIVNDADLEAAIVDE